VQVPKVTFFDVWVLPTSEIEVTTPQPYNAAIRALDTTIEGSHHVQELDCQNRLDLNLDVRLQGKQDMCAPQRVQSAIAVVHMHGLAAWCCS
jgi:hypothetical protein